MTISNNKILLNKKKKLSKEFLDELGQGKEFLGLTSRAKSITRKHDKLFFINMKNFCFPKAPY